MADRTIVGHQYDIFGDLHEVDSAGNVNPSPVARAGDPQTSWDAARSVRPFTIRRLHDIQLALLRIEPDTHNGLWGRYLAGQVEHEWPTVSMSGFRTRVSELVAAALVEDSGQRATLPTGRKSTIWRITQVGRDVLAEREGV